MKIEDKIEELNRLHTEVQEFKRQNPDARIGLLRSPGGVLNAYREGDLTFDEAVALLEMRGPKTIEQLAEEQGVEPITDVEALGGLFPDEDVDEFVAEIYRDREAGR